MKKKALSYYLDLMKSALDKQDWGKAKRYCESALKSTNKLSYTPLEIYTLYTQISYAYSKLAEYSSSLNALYKADLIAAKHHLAPVYSAYTTYEIGFSLLSIRNLSQALNKFKKVEQYYQKYGDGVVPMGKREYFNNLIGLGYCYLYKNKLGESQEVINKLSLHLPFLSDGFTLAHYYHLKGRYSIAVKEYGQARQSFAEVIKFSEQISFRWLVSDTQIHLAVIHLLEKQLNPAVQILESVFKGAWVSKYYDIICEAGLVLSKCYYFMSLPEKTHAIEREIKPVLDKLDILWLYEKTREFEQLYRQLIPLYPDSSSERIARSGKKKVDTQFILTDAINQRRETLSYNDIVIGQTTSMQEAFQIIDKIAQTDLPVLIQGETGTGKELVARTIHQKSLRKGKKWLVINCGAVAETLLENELFGHVKGAFTDAHQAKKGHIELASNGTLFLDEISEMSPAMQQKFLRIMEDKMVWRLGSEKPILVNTRLIFASNQNVEELVKRKSFRQDLFYRINTIVITLPPLRDRRDDIPLLINHFLEKYSRVETLRPKGTQGDQQEKCHSEGVKRPKNLVEITPSTLDLLVNYNWSGNIRELENEIKRICALYPNAKEITEKMLSRHICRDGSESIRHYPLRDTVGDNLTVVSTIDPLSFKNARKLAEKNIITDALTKSDGNIRQTARYLGCSRRYLQRKMRQLKILTSDFVTKR